MVIREPGVAEPKHPIEDGRASAANKDWWMWPLRRFGPGPDPVEVDIFAVVAGLVIGPDLLHGLDTLPHHDHPDARVGAMIAHLGPVPARTHPELQAAAREVVDARDLFRRDDRVTFNNQADAAGDADIAGRLRGGGEVGRFERSDLEPWRCRGGHRSANGIGRLIDDARTRTYIHCIPPPSASGHVLAWASPNPIPGFHVP